MPDFDTLWTKASISLPRLEWKKEKNNYAIERTLPNGIIFGTRIQPTRSAVLMTMWLKNGSTGRLSDLRVQNCVMLKGMKGFEDQTKENKVLQAPYAACHSHDKKRWVITAWTPNHRTWANPPVPCLHADPKFPDCEPGESRTLKGILAFYEGDDIQAEFAGLQRLGWDKGASLPSREK